MKTDIEVVDGAIDILSDDESWTRGTWCTVTETGLTYCVEGAVIEAATGIFTHMALVVPPEWLNDGGYNIDQDDANMGITGEQQAQISDIFAKLVPIYMRLTPMSDEDKDMMGLLNNSYPTWHVFHWNDLPRTSREDIVLGLKQLREELADGQ